jgi:F0F1-type ATP synthase assembly protein I
MADQKKFQNRKLDKNDHKDIDNAAKKSREAAGGVAVAAVIGIFIKKYGKNIINMMTKIKI